jgi:HPt (histidine-containing phosphotransfer) domain-containing protein
MPVNLQILREYLNYDENMVHRFLHLFCLSIPDDLEKLKSFLFQSDFEMGSVTAHGIKTQCAYLGLEDARSIAEKIENINTVNPLNSGLFDQLENILINEISEIKMTLSLNE